ncbi:hypothetical protein ACIPVK_09505 [Paeniglutamicibacter sp. MACA_103]|uniref:hypothetical protein n=1 Tax=Paeniglutamicibacter sp. MACA_103 TaxID=3377337 RepID=UPI003893EB0A
MQLTEEDLLLGRRVVKYTSLLCVISLIACLAAAVFVFLNVPADTRMPYDGKYDRSGAGIPMQIVLLLAPAFIIKLWWPSRKPDAHHMNRASRIVISTLKSIFVALCLIFQWIFAKEILTVGGYFAG